MSLNTTKLCKYCHTECTSSDFLALKCKECQLLVHLKCLKRGAVPGGLLGDVFFEFTCCECVENESEGFYRHKMSWFQAILLVLYNMQSRNPGIAKKGYFHWKIHIASFIDKHWDIIFKRGFKRKKNWTGTISGTLSLYSPFFFKSGTEILKEQGWWKLSFPSLTPNVVIQLHAELSLRKQKRKHLKLPLVEDFMILKEILQDKGFNVDELSNVNIDISKSNSLEWSEDSNMSSCSSTEEALKPAQNKRKLSTFEQNIKKLKVSSTRTSIEEPAQFNKSGKISHPTQIEMLSQPIENVSYMQTRQFFNRFVLYETPSRPTDWNIITGSIVESQLRSRYSNRILPPYIYRSYDCPHKCLWLKLMDEIQMKVNSKKFEWKLPVKRTLDFVYLQPTLIPAINALCNQFFWSGIDISKVDEFPDFCCVVVYGKLIVAFALLVPDVAENESYLAFIFTRPGWRRAGIANIMLYFLIQTNTARDITFHVSKNNNALILFNKFCCKLEGEVRNFYKYTKEDINSSRCAFLGRIKAFV